MTTNTHVFGRRCLAFLLVVLPLVQGARAAGAATPQTGANDLAQPQPAHPALLTVYSPDGAFCATASQDGRIRCRTAAEDGLVLTRYHCSPRALAFSANGRVLACVGGAGEDFASVQVWELSSGRLLSSWKTAVTTVAQTTRVALSPDGSLLALSAGEPIVSLWSVAEGQKRWAAAVKCSVADLSFAEGAGGVKVRCVDDLPRTFALADGASITPALLSE